VFALIMALSNLGSSLAAMLGGHLYDDWAALWGPTTSFNLLVAVGVATTGLCWLIVPRLARDLPA
jgi:predicted MFS family arabinose efflux permease